MKIFEIEGHAPSLLPDGEWKLFWSDEFDGDTLDTSKWSFRLNFWGKRLKVEGEFIDDAFIVDYVRVFNRG